MYTKFFKKFKLKITVYVLFRRMWGRCEDNTKMNLGRTDCEDGNWDSVASGDPTDVYGTGTCNCVSPGTARKFFHSKKSNGPSTYCVILVHKHALMCAALM